MVTKRMSKKRIIKGAIDSFIEFDHKKVLNILKLVADIEITKNEVVEYLTKLLDRAYDTEMAKIDSLENSSNVAVGKYNEYDDDHRLRNYFRIVVVGDSYYGIIRMGIFLVLHEGDSFDRYDMSSLTYNSNETEFYETTTSIDGDYVVRTSKLHKNQYKSTKNWGMKQFYKEMAKDPYHLNSDGNFYLSDGMVLCPDGTIKED